MSGLSVTETSIDGLLLLELPVFGDNRGWFKENWQRENMVALGLPDFRPIQQNMSFNESVGVTRGVHAGPWDQLVSVCGAGRVFGAWVDLRPGPGFGQVFSTELTTERAIYVPRGVGNAFQTLEAGTVISCLVNQPWSAETKEQGTSVYLGDPQLGISWPIPLEQAVISEADRDHPALRDVEPMTPRRTLVLGAGGLLGRALRKEFADQDSVSFLGRRELDIADRVAVGALDLTGVGTVINAAAYTDVDGAETPEGRQAAWAVNATGVAALAARCEETGATLVHVSSEYVFDGTGAGPYLEEAAFCPLGVYAQTKAAGEVAVSAIERHYIVRTSWVVGDGPNFVSTMADLARRGVSPKVVSDQVGRLTSSSTLAAAIRHLLKSRPAYGVYNVTGAGEPLSWAAIAELIFARLGRDHRDVAHISAEEYGRGRHMAPRPENSVLDLTKISACGFEPPAHTLSIAAVLDGPLTEHARLTLPTGESRQLPATEGAWVLIVADGHTSERDVTPVLEQLAAGQDLPIVMADTGDHERWLRPRQLYGDVFSIREGFADLEAMHAYLSSVPAPAAVFELTGSSKSFKRQLGANLLFYLTPGGYYDVRIPEREPAGYVDQAGPDVCQTLLRAFAASGAGSEREAADAVRLGRNILEVSAGKNRVVAKTAMACWRKLRDAAATQVLNSKYGSSWGEEVSVLPASEFKVRSVLTTNRHADRFVDRCTLPAIHTRRYSAAECSYGQVLTYGDKFLPDTFRKPKRRQANNRLDDLSPEFARAVVPSTVQRARGAYLYVDTEFPDHFGHLTTDVLGRLSAYPELRQEVPGLGIVLSSEGPGWVLEILDALKVPADRRLLIQPGETWRVDELWTRTPAMSHPLWILPSFGDFWAELKERLVGKHVPTGRPVFSTRVPGGRRSCTRIVEVERLFEKAGFETLLPAKLSFTEQVRRFAAAPAVAGFGGSNTFQMMFSPPGQRIVVTGDSYTARNEYFIAAVSASPIHYSYHDSEIQHPKNGWSVRAFHSNFGFDLDADPQLLQVLRDS